MSRRNMLPYIKRVGALVVILLLILVIRSIVLSIFSTHDRSQILQQLEGELSQKKRLQAYLSQKVYYAKTDNFVEEEARSKLGLVKDGEEVVIDQKIEPERLKSTPPDMPIYQKWWNLFF